MHSTIFAVAMAFIANTLLGFTFAQGIGTKDLFKCRQSCYQKFVHDWHHCMDFEDCKNMCITPPNINSYIPEAFSFLCWNNCDQALGPFPLNINSAIRQGSLVLTDIGWDQAITNASKQCLVTWEVSGGGLMGNLLTDSSTVELSLWPDTVYHVQVTCKHKETGGMRRSFKLIVDTRKLSENSPSGMQSIAMETNMKLMPNIFATETSSSETESRMRILKDSSKDFISSYNPDVNIFPVHTRTKPISKILPSSSSESPSKLSSSSSTPVTLSVVRTKLSLSVPSSNGSSEYVTESLVFAIVGSVVLFLGLLVIFMLTRPVRKETPASAIDKEVLIRNELLPSSTPIKSTAAMTFPIQQTSKSSSRSAKTTATTTTTTAATIIDSRTLHV